MIDDDSIARTVEIARAVFGEDSGVGVVADGRSFGVAVRLDEQYDAPEGSASSGWMQTT